MSVPVLIVGAGPVGLSLACVLERQGTEHRIVDAAREPQAVSRATDLHARSLELWDHTGVADAILAEALPISGVPLFSGGREVARLDFAGVDSPYPAAVSLRQRELEALLSRHLEAEVERGAPVELLGQDADGVDARVGSDMVRADYLVACDGVHSGVRHAVGITFEGGDYPGRWAVMDAAVDDWPYGAEIPVFLDHEGFWAMPLPNGRVRLFFRDDAAAEAPAVADGQAVIDRHVPGGARIREADNRAVFRVHHRVAHRFRAGRVLLAGDAAHAMTPVSGQGMNTGIQDAYNLAWKLRLALAGAPDAVLDSYDGERRPVAVATMKASGEVHDANVLSGDAAVTRDRALAASLATPDRVLAAVESGHELGIAYDPSPVVGGEAAAGGLGVAPGQRGPDAGPLIRADGSTTSLRELLHEPDLQIWLCAGTDTGLAGTDPVQRIALQARTLVFVVANRAQERHGSVELIADPGLRGHGRLGAVANAAYVVRPDGHLGFRCEPPDADLVAGYLTGLGLAAGEARESRSGPAASRS
jgi:2-polyprenyl-6-methoxyphenol hydroxylase-like FAD-dependent oxidoreductase